MLDLVNTWTETYLRDEVVQMINAQTLGWEEKLDAVYRALKTQHPKNKSLKTTDTDNEVNLEEFVNSFKEPAIAVKLW